MVVVLRSSEAEADTGELRPFPGVGGGCEARRAGDELAPGGRGGPEVDAAEELLERVLGGRLEADDRLVLGEQELVAGQRRVTGVEGRPVLDELDGLGK